ncbi:unnamed protein product [Arabidopsis arenosa]|uniref:Chromo domain-containing protein n=1 Tax=Arabidopsis arenosa TaxID=38785 RepID=A0A8S2B0L4_ARAAE|nr:unnamed protein product [Arabidopsis arenosa]
MVMTQELPTITELSDAEQTAASLTEVHEQLTDMSNKIRRSDSRTDSKLESLRVDLSAKIGVHDQQLVDIGRKLDLVLCALPGIATVQEIGGSSHGGAPRSQDRPNQKPRNLPEMVAEARAMESSIIRRVVKKELLLANKENYEADSKSNTTFNTNTWKMKSIATDSVQMSLKSLSSGFTLSTKGVEVELCNQQLLQAEGQPLTEGLQEVLTKYDQVFEIPTGLPPIRGREHSINLLPGNNAISVRPYRYPHAQKEIMEKMVQEMLDSDLFTEEDEVIIEPETVIETRYNANGVLEALVHWRGLPDHENTWEVVKDLQRQYPTLALEDKLRFEGGGIDKLHNVYIRKKSREATRVQEEKSTSEMVMTQELPTITELSDAEQTAASLTEVHEQLTDMSNKIRRSDSRTDSKLESLRVDLSAKIGVHDQQLVDIGRKLDLVLCALPGIATVQEIGGSSHGGAPRSQDRPNQKPRNLPEMVAEARAMESSIIRRVVKKELLLANKENYEADSKSNTTFNTNTWKMKSIATDSVQMSLKSLSSGFTLSTKGVEVELCNQQLLQAEGQPLTEGLQEVLTKYDQVFEIPTGLPPIRGREHSINLLPGNNAISVRPYRYPHAQKEIMEKMVQEMLDSDLFTEEDEVIIEPETVIETRYNANGVLEALVHWRGLPDHENTWEVVKDLQRQYPTLALEDKLRFEGGGIDKLHNVYIRKKSREATRVQEEKSTSEMVMTQELPTITELSDAEQTAASLTEVHEQLTDMSNKIRRSDSRTDSKLESLRVDLSAKIGVHDQQLVDIGRKLDLVLCALPGIATVQEIGGSSHGGAPRSQDRPNQKPRNLPEMVAEARAMESSIIRRVVKKELLLANKENYEADSKSNTTFNTNTWKMKSIATDSVQMSLKSLSSGFTLSTKGVEVELCNQQLLQAEGQPLTEGLQEVLTKYDQVFEIPTGLPPIRGREHSINLLPGNNAISVRPYRYPHAQKEIMEKMVQEMLDSDLFTEEDEVIIEPETVIETRYNANGVLEALVHWRGLPDHENTWEVVKDLQRQYPTLALEDKLRFEGGGIDKLHNVYIRKKSREATRVQEEKSTSEMVMTQELPTITELSDAEQTAASLTEVHEQLTDMSNKIRRSDSRTDSKLESLRVDLSAKIGVHDQQLVDIGRKLDLVLCALPGIATVQEIGGSSHGGAPRSQDRPNQKPRNLPEMVAEARAMESSIIRRVVKKELLLANKENYEADSKSNTTFNTNTWKMKSIATDSVQMSLKSLSSGFTLSTKGVEVELCNQQLLQAEGQPLTEGLQEVLTKYDQVFEIPTGLPPIRGREHSINLLPGNNAISVRPYRYPHAQKEIMEKMVQEMLDSGVRAANLDTSVQAADSLMKLVSKLKQTSIFSGFASLNDHVEQRIEEFDQEAEKTNRLLARIADDASASLKELESHHYSSPQRLTLI